jgi:hypothetical protein
MGRKSYKENGVRKQERGVDVLLTNKPYFNPKLIKRNKEGNSILIKVILHHKDITIANIHAFYVNIIVMVQQSRYYKRHFRSLISTQKLSNFKLLNELIKRSYVKLKIIGDRFSIPKVWVNFLRLNILVK